MGILPASSFQDYFATLTDPRCPDAPNSRHQLMDMLIIAVCAVICGADGWEDIEEYGTSQAEWFATFVDLPQGIPGPDTFRRVLSRLAPRNCPSAVSHGPRPCARPRVALSCLSRAKHGGTRLIGPAGKPPSLWCVRGPAPIVSG